MPEVPVTLEVTEFLANVLKATRRGALDWQHEESSGILRVTLEGDYLLTLQEVSDFDGQTNDPDHILTLFANGQKLFALDRRLITGEMISASLGEKVDHSYAVFIELWKEALLKALKLSEHIAVLNRALEKKL